MISSVQPFKKIYTQVIFVVALLLFSVSTMGMLVTTVDAEADKRVFQIESNWTRANLITDSNGKYRGITDCETQTDGANIFNGGNATNKNSSSCVGTFLTGISVGDSYTNQTIYMKNVNIDPVAQTGKIDGVTVTCFATAGRRSSQQECYAQADNGSSKPLSPNLSAALKSGSCVKVSECQIAIDEVNAISGSLKNGVGAETALEKSVNAEKTAALDAAIKKATELSKNGVTCRARIDADKKAVYACTKDGKPVGPQGEALNADCKAKEVNGEVLFRIGADDKLTGCLTKEDSAKVVAGNTNNQVKSKESTTGGGANDIGAILLDIFAKIILIVLWIISSILSIILALMMSVLGAFLQINPASPSFLSVAIEPWRVVVSIANLVTLFSFLYTGFNYILGVKNKKPIGEFFINVIVVVLTINFTIFGAAAFVNIAQGIGDTFVGAYSSVAEPGKSYGEVLLANFTSGVGEVSLLRCGGAEKELKLPGKGCKESAGKTTNNMFTTLFGGKVGDAQAATAGEAAYILIVGYAIFVIWQALLIVLVRVVALWLLMVTSPFALAAFFSPIPQLQKLANQWVEYFLNYTMIYPVIVLGFVLVGQVSKSFGTAARANIEAGGIGAVQAAEQAGTFQKILPLILVGLVSVGALNLLVAFLKTFKNVTDGLWSGAKMLAKGTGQAGSLLARGAGGAVGALAQNKVNKTKTEISKLKGLQTKRDKELLDASAITNRGDRNREIKRILQTYKQKGGKSLESNIERLEKYKEGKEKLVNSARGLKYLPERIQGISQIPKRAWKNYSKQREADRSQNKAEYDTARELYARQSGRGGIFDGPDSPYSGFGPEEIQRNVDKDPNWIKNQIAAQGNKASAKVYDSKYKMDRDTSLETIKQLGKKSKGDWNELDTKEQERMTQAFQQTLGTEQYAQEIAGVDGAVDLVKYAYKNRLLDDETEAVLDKLPIFQSDLADQRRLGQLAASSKGEADKMPGYSMTPESASAYLEAKEAAGQGKQGTEYLNEKMGYEGGLPRFNLSQQKARGDAAAKDEGEVYQSVRNGLYEELSTKAVDQTRLAGRLHEELKSNVNTQPGSISDERISEIVNQSQAESFGVSSESEMRAALAGDAAIMQRVKDSSIGQLVDNKTTLSPDQKEKLLRDTLESSVKSFEDNKGFYRRKVADAAKQQYQEVKNFESETMLQSNAQKSLDQVVSSMRRGESVSDADFKSLAVHEAAKKSRKSIEDDFGTQLGGGKEDFKRDYNQLVAASVENNTSKINDIKEKIDRKYGSVRSADNTRSVSEFVTANLGEMSNRITTEQNALASKYANGNSGIVDEIYGTTQGDSRSSNSAIIDELNEMRTSLGAEVKAAKKSRREKMSNFGGTADQLLQNGVLN